MSVASGSLAVAHNALGHTGATAELEPARRVEVKNLDPDEIDRQIEFYSSVIDQARDRVNTSSAN